MGIKSVVSFVLLFAFLGGVPPAGALRAEPQEGAKPKPAETAAEPAPIEEVEEVAAVETPATLTPAALLGRMHPALVHFPIGWVFLLLLLEIYSRATGRREWTGACLAILIVACLSFVPAAASGFLRADSITDNPEFRALMIPHRNMNLAAAIGCVSALVLRVKGHAAGPGRWVYLLLLAGSAVLLLSAGHLGGKMVFGPAYLPF